MKKADGFVILTRGFKGVQNETRCSKIAPEVGWRCVQASRLPGSHTSSSDRPPSMGTMAEQVDLQRHRSSGSELGLRNSFPSRTPIRSVGWAPSGAHVHLPGRESGISRSCRGTQFPTGIGEMTIVAGTQTRFRRMMLTEARTTGSSSGGVRGWTGSQLRRTIGVSRRGAMFFEVSGRVRWCLTRCFGSKTVTFLQGLMLIRFFLPFFLKDNSWSVSPWLD
jgi:hypothetical protein